MKTLQTLGLIYSDRKENSNKFYILSITEFNGDYKVIVANGRLGRKPRITPKLFISLIESEIYFRNKIKMKKKGIGIIQLN